MMFPQSSSFMFAMVGVAFGQEFTLPINRAFYSATDQAITTSILHPNLMKDDGTGARYTLDVKYYDGGCDLLVNYDTGGLSAAVDVANRLVSTSTVADSTGAINTEAAPGPEGLWLTTHKNPIVNIREHVGTTTGLPVLYSSTDDAATYNYCIQYTLSSAIVDNIAPLAQARYSNVKLTASKDGSVSTDVDILGEIDSDAGADTYTARAFPCTISGSSVTELLEAPTFTSEAPTATICVESVDFPEASIIGIDSFTAGGAAITLTEVTTLLCTVTDGTETCAFTFDIAETLFTDITSGSTASVAIAGTMLMKFGSARRLVMIERRVQVQEFPRNAATEVKISAAQQDDADDDCFWDFVPILGGFLCTMMRMIMRAINGGIDFFRGIF